MQKTKITRIVIGCVAVLAVAAIVSVAMFLLRDVKSDTIFDLRTVMQIYVGDSTQKISLILGEPNKRSEDKSKFFYFEKSNGNEIYGNRYIEITFQDNLVTELYLDMQHGSADETNKTMITYRVEKSNLFLGETHCDVEFSARFSDGSFYRGKTVADCIEIDNSSYDVRAKIEWSDKWGHKYLFKTFVLGADKAFFGTECYIKDDTLVITGNNFKLSNDMTDLRRCDYRQIKNIVVRENVTELNFQSSRTDFRRWTALERVDFQGNIQDWYMIDFGVNPLKFAHNLFINGFPVDEVTIASNTWISDRSFAYCENLTAVTVADGLTEIGAEAFLGCKNLRSVILPESLTFIGSNAFSECNSIKTATISHALIDYFNFSVLTDLKILGEYIPSSAFEGCAQLENITIDDSISTIGSRAFFDCINLQSLLIGDGVMSICDYAFGNCKSLLDIRIPSNVTEIGFGAFEGCSNIKRMEIPFIGALADDHSGSTDFSYIFGSVELPQESAIPRSLQTIVFTGDTLIENAFKDCKFIREIRLDGNIPEIPFNAFYGCENLSCLEIPNSVISIESAFSGCNSLLTITLPQNVRYVAPNAFSGAIRLFEIINLSGRIINTDNTSVKNICADPFDSKIIINDGYIFYDDDIRYYLIGFEKSFGMLHLPETFNGQQYYIHKYAFLGFNNSTDVILPYGITNVNSEWFSRNAFLQSIILPDTVSEIADGAFNGCKSLKTVILSNTISTLEQDVFAHCTALESIVLPRNLELVSYGAFTGCTSLKNVYYKGSPEEWENIVIAPTEFAKDNSHLINSRKFYYSETSPIDATHNYWHYNEHGDIVAWN